jgi:hypothetical protein
VFEKRGGTTSPCIPCLPWLWMFFTTESGDCAEWENDFLGHPRYGMTRCSWNSGKAPPQWPSGGGEEGVVPGRTTGAKNPA